MEKPSFETPKWLNKKFIGTALRDNVSDDSLVVQDVEFTNVDGKPGRYGSHFHRVTITYKNATTSDNKHHLIVKSLPTNEAAKSFLIRWKYFERELNMYQVTLPAMYALIPKIVSKHLPPNDPFPLSAHPYITQRQHTVILDDLRPAGYALCTKKLGLDHSHSSMALVAMAKFHALSLALFKKDPQSMDMYAENFFIESNREEIRLRVEQPFIDLPNEVAKWTGFEHFADRLRSIPVVDKVIAAMSVKEGRVSVLNHGDFWITNMMFKYNKGGEALGVKLVDFQQCRFVSPALDIIHFMFSSPSEVVRDSFWDTFVEVYHKSFCDTLKLTRTDPTILSVEHLTQDIQDKMFFGLLIACTILPLTLATLEGIPLQDGAIYSGERFKKAFQKLLHFFEKRGIL